MMNNKKILIPIIIIILVVLIIISIYNSDFQKTSLKETFNKELDNKKINHKVFKGAYTYGIEQSKYIDAINNTNGNVKTVYPSFFNLSEYGNLILAEEIDDNIMKSIKEKNIKIVPFLSNHWDRKIGERSLVNYESLASQVSNEINKNNFDGVNIDIENVDEVFSGKYIELVKSIREKVGKDKIVSIAVAANPDGKKAGWVASFDYKALSRYCDYLILMAYDEHYPGRDEGPVASKEFVEKSILNAIGKVSPTKVVLGIPLYGRYWKGGLNTGENGIRMDEIRYLLSKYNGQTKYDSDKECYIATLTIDKFEKRKVNNQILGVGKYSIWYDDKKSYNSKFKLMKKYNLKGFAVWRLGQENSDFWDNIN